MFLSHLLRVCWALLCLYALVACQDQTAEPVLKKRFSGQSITIMVPKLDSIRNPVLDAKQAFEAATGAKIRVLSPSWQDSPAKLRQSLQNPANGFDIYMMIAMWNSELLAGNHIEPIPPNIKQALDWDDVLPIYRDTVLSWDGVAYGYPYDGDCINLYYRKDILANPEYQKKFFKKYGYALAAPQTWAQYRDVAEFFTGWDWDHDGKPNYGIVGVRDIGKNTQQQFLAQAAAFAKHPNDVAYYFDPTTMQPKINHPGFVKALELMVNSMQFGAPDLIHYGSLDARSHFIAGDAAMIIDWADTPIHAIDSTFSKIKGKVGYGQLPASDEVYNAKTQQWEKRINRVASISGNWLLLVSKHSKHKALAMEYAAFMTSKAMTTQLMIDNTAVVNPSRYSHFKNIQLWTTTGFDAVDAKLYLDAILQSLNNPNRQYDLNIPHASDYYAVLDANINLALRKKISPQVALNHTATAWDKLTNQLGRANQAKNYRASLNMIAASD